MLIHVTVKRKAEGDDTRIMKKMKLIEWFEILITGGAALCLGSSVANIMCLKMIV